MKKIIFILGGCAVLLLLLIGGLWLAAVAYLNSGTLKTLLESRLSEATTTPVTIEELSPSWTGLVLEGVRIPNEPPYTDDFLLTRAFALKLDWFSLLAEAPEIQAVVIRNPVLVMHQTEEGGMALPLVASGDGAGTGSGASGRDLSLEALNLEEAIARAVGPDGGQLFLAEGISMNSSVQLVGGAWQSAGSLACRKLVAGPVLTFTNLSSPLEFTGGRLLLSEIKGSAYDGKVLGSSGVDFNQADPVFRFVYEGEQLSADQLMQDFGQPAGSVSGALGLSIEGEGRASEPKNLKASGQFSMTPARVAKLEAARVLGDILGIQVMKDGSFQEIVGTFKISDQTIHFSKLDVVSENVSVTLSGAVGFDQRLNLKGQVVVEPGASIVSTSLLGRKVDSERQRVRVLPLTITGTSGDPKVQIDWVGAGLEAGLDLMNRFLRPEEKGGSDRGKEPAEAVDSLIQGIFGN